MGGHNWLNNSRWDTKKPVCSWFGIVCDSSCSPSDIKADNCEILEINLEGNNLKGTISNILPQYLRTLNVAKNLISGTIPSFSSLYNLQHLFIHNNQLSGTIPILPASLQAVNLSENPQLAYPRQLLMILYNQTTGDGWVSNSKWNTTSSVCAWHGIECHSACPAVQVELSLCPLTSISLGSNNLVGSIPSGLWNIGFSELATLDLSANSLSGTVPELNMQELKSLDLQFNQLTGTIHDLRLPQLMNLFLNDNLLTSFIPQSTLPKLVYLYLGKNRLAGILALPNMTELTYLDVNNNLFTSISSSLRLPSLTILDISRNKLNGMMPSFEQFPGLVKIDVSFNQLETISSQNLPRLQTLLASSNRITGSLPDLTLPLLTQLDLSKNNLNLPLPAWESLSNLERLIISDNPGLTGPLPSGMDSCMKLSDIDMMNTSMQASGTNILPKVLEPNGQFQLQSTSDSYQCPVLANKASAVTRSNVDMNPSYYHHINCRCLPGTFGFRNKCSECPIGCICDDGLSIKGCIPTPNLQNITKVLACPNPSACESSISSKIVLTFQEAAQDPSVCLRGYEGRVCSKCESGYGSQGRSCVECQGASTYASFVLVPLFIFFFVAFLYKTDAQSSGKLNILIFHTQTLSVIATTMANTPAVDRVVNFSFSIGSLQIPNLACLLGSTDAFQPMVYSFARLPFLVGFGLLAFKYTSGHKRDKVVYIVLNLARFIYYGVTLDTIGVLGCTLYDEGHDSWYLNAWPWVSCNPVSKEYKNMLAISLPTLILFVCGLPVLFLFIIQKYAQHTTKNGNESERISKKTRYGFLYFPYEKENRFWELVVMGRLILFGLVIRIVPYTTLSILFVLLMLIMQGSIWMQHKSQPYLAKDENAMELTSLYVIFFSYFLVLVAGMLGDPGWIIGLVVIVNFLVLGWFAWRTFGTEFLILIGKRKKVNTMVSMANIPSFVREIPPGELDTEMKSISR